MLWYTPPHIPLQPKKLPTRVHISYVYSFDCNTHYSDQIVDCECLGEEFINKIKRDISVEKGIGSRLVVILSITELSCTPEDHA